MSSLTVIRPQTEESFDVSEQTDRGDCGSTFVWMPTTTHKDMYTCTNRGIQRHTQAYKETHMYTCTDRGIQKHTKAYMHRRRHTKAHTGIQRQTHAYMHRQRQMAGHHLITSQIC